MRKINYLSIFLFCIIKKFKIKFMLKNYNPILIVSGEPKSIFLEIFFKALNKKAKSPLVLIVNKKF